MITETFKGLYYLSYMAKYFHPEHYNLAWRVLPLVKQELKAELKDNKNH